MNRVRFYALLLGLGLALVPTRAAGQDLVKRYELIELTVDGATQARAYSINETGQAVGYVEIGGTHHATHWHNRVYTDLHGTVHLALQHPYMLFDEDNSEAYAISNAGQIIGTSRTSIKCDEASFIITNAYVMRPAVLTDLATPYPGDALTNLLTFCSPCAGGFDSVAVGISNANHIVGWADTGDDLVLPRRVTRAFLLTPTNGQYVQLGADFGNDLMIDLGTLGASDPVSSATAVSDDGRVTGYSYTLTSDGLAAYHAFLVNPLDNNGDGRGDQWFVQAGNGVNALMVDIGTLGGNNSWGRAINSNGDVVGESDVDLAGGEHYTHAFRWAGGVLADLGTLRSDATRGFSAASSVNDGGVVVGWAEDDRMRRRAFVYEGGQMQDLNELLYLQDEDGRRLVSSIVLTEARDINEDGVIVGWGEVRGTSGAQTRGFVLNPIWVDPATLVEAEPEPEDDGSSGDGGNAGAHANDPYTGAPVFGIPSHMLNLDSPLDPNVPLGAAASMGLCGGASVALTLAGLVGMCMFGGARSGENEAPAGGRVKR